MTQYYFSTSSFVAGVMIGILLAGVYFLSSDAISLPSLLATTPYSVATSTALTTETSGIVSVANQPAGSSVAIDSLTVPSVGMWVAVREVKSNGLGNVLGAARVGGAQSSFPVSLLRATEPSQQYAVQLYRDDGNGSFDPALNSVYIDFDTGAPVIAYFKTTP